MDLQAHLTPLATQMNRSASVIYLSHGRVHCRSRSKYSQISPDFTRATSMPLGTPTPTLQLGSRIYDDDVSLVGVSKFYFLRFEEFGGAFAAEPDSSLPLGTSKHIRDLQIQADSLMSRATSLPLASTECPGNCKFVLVTASHDL